jgi:hypothetical protein
MHDILLLIIFYLFWKNFRNVAIPIMPLPTRSIVAGSGTGAGLVVG